MGSYIKNMSLKRQLVFLICITTIISLVVQVFYCLNLYWGRWQEVQQTSQATIRQTDTSLDSMLNQIKMTGQTMADTPEVQRYLRYQNEAAEDSIEERGQLRDFLISYIKGLIGSNEAILDIALLSKKGDILTYRQLLDYNYYQALDRQYDLGSRTAAFFTSWSSFGRNVNMRVPHFTYVLPIRYTAGSFAQRMERLGYCVVFCQQQVLETIVSNTAVTPNSFVAIADETGNIIAQNDTALPDALAGSLDKLTEQYQQLSPDNSIVSMDLQGIRYNVLIKKNKLTGWKTINLTPINEIYADTMNTLYLGIGLAVFGILVVFLVGNLTVRSITKPLSYITSTVKRIGKSEGKERLLYSADNEFGEICRSVNAMLDETEKVNQRVLQMQTRLYETELLQKEAEVMALQSQINPHFLYNTLECIRSIASVHGVKEISVLTASMANIFRYSIMGGTQSTVKAEMDCVMDYYKIISIRCGGRLTMDVDISEALYSCGIVKMSLQPLLENVVNHGLEMSENDIHIQVIGRQEEDLAVFVVQDDGVGMSRERLMEVRRMLAESKRPEGAERRRTGGIGLSNINGRIKLFYGEEYGLQIDSEENVGTVVRMNIPLDKNPDRIETK